mmetsp:Transcript_106573/g.229469  ORF Transcript_106573/g.229469 Transcript_106573/m.229469 type:complete len:96 (+) Transcript_106573:502-789(+)
MCRAVEKDGNYKGKHIAKLTELVSSLQNYDFSVYEKVEVKHTSHSKKQPTSNSDAQPQVSVPQTVTKSALDEDSEDDFVEIKAKGPKKTSKKAKR